MAVVKITTISNYIGYSTDTKPADAIAGSKFFELDTSKEYKFDGSNWVEWVVSTGGSSANTTLIKENKTLNGSAQQLANQSTKVFTIQSHPDNVGYVYIGDSNVSNSVYVAILVPGASITFTLSNTNKIYVLGTSGDKVAVGGEV